MLTSETLSANFDFSFNKSSKTFLKNPLDFIRSLIKGQGCNCKRPRKGFSMHQIKVANNEEGCDLFRIWLWALTDIEAQLFCLYVMKKVRRRATIHK